MPGPAVKPATPTPFTSVVGKIVGAAIVTAAAVAVFILLVAGLIGLAQLVGLGV